MQFNIAIDHAVGAPGHVRDVMDGLNAVDKVYLNKTMFGINAKSKHSAKDMMAHLCTPSKKISYASKFRDLLQDRKNDSNLHTSTARAKRKDNVEYKVRHYNVQEKICESQRC
eukprot:4503028-Ditylum_brightwellii.AAC.1